VLGQSNIGNVPTTLERSGDFTRSWVSGTGAKLYLRDPLATGACNAPARRPAFPATGFRPAASIRSR